MANFTNPTGVSVGDDGVENTNDYAYSRDTFTKELYSAIGSAGSINEVEMAIKSSISSGLSPAQQSNFNDYILDMMTPSALSSVTDVVILGASISDAVVSSKATFMKRMFANNGLTITVHDESTGGRHVDEILAHWETVKANYTAMGATCLVFMHCLGNDVSSYQPFSSMSTAQIDTLESNLDSLVASVTGNGNLPLLAETTFRDYDTDVSVDTFLNEDNGSKPFNERFLYPKAENLAPAQWWKLDKRPYIALYNWSYNFGKLVLEDSTNRIHYTTDGTELLRRIWVDGMTNRINGDKPISFIQNSYEVATSVTREPKEILLGVTLSFATGPSPSLPGGSVMQVSATNDSRYLAPISGYEPTSINVSSAQDVLDYGVNHSITDDGNYVATLENWLTKSLYGKFDSTEYVELFKLGGYTPNSSLKIGIASYYVTTTSQVMEVMINNDLENTLVLDAKTDSGTNVAWGNVTADSNGFISIKAKKNSGTYAYFNAIHVIPA